MYNLNIIKKKFKTIYALIIITIIIIINIAIFYLYKYFTKQIDNFEINNIISSSIQNYYKGEPAITTINNQGIIYANIKNITKESPCEYIVSNNTGIYGTDNKNLYYFNNNDNKWYITYIKPNKPTVTNPSFNNTKKVCRFKTTLCASKSTLWYYNDNLNDKQNINIDCLYYINLDLKGNPIINTNTNLVDLTCLRLPLINKIGEPTTTVAPTTTSGPTTTTSAFTKPYLSYDRLKLFSSNDNILFAVGCEILNNPTTIYYCKLTNGKPSNNTTSVWNTIQVPIKSQYIKNIIVNDNYVFIYYYGNDSNTNNDNSNIKSIYYNAINFNSDNTFNTNWQKWTISLLDTYNFDYIVLNNDIFIGFQNYIDNSSNSIVSKIFWHPLIIDPTNNTKIQSDKWNNMSFNESINILNMVMYNNKLVGYNNLQNSKLFVINLYGYDNTDLIQTNLVYTNIIVSIILALINSISNTSNNETVAVSDVINLIGLGNTAGATGTTSTAAGSGGSGGSGGAGSGATGATSTTARAGSGGAGSGASGSSATSTTARAGSGGSGSSATSTTARAGSGATSTTARAGSGGSGGATSDPDPDSLIFDYLNNLNSGMSHNNIIGSNLYISPMNNKDLNDQLNDSYLTKTSTKNKNIDSYFYPMIKIV